MCLTFEGIREAARVQTHASSKAHAHRERQTDRQTDRQRERERERERYTHTHTHTHMRNSESPMHIAKNKSVHKGCTHAHQHTCKFVQARVCKTTSYARARAHTHTHMHTHIHTCTHICTLAQANMLTWIACDDESRGRVQSHIFLLSIEYNDSN